MVTLPVLLKNPRIVILGGGAVALQKATVLARNEISFSLISSDFLPQFKQFNQIQVVKNIQPEDLLSFNIIVDATGCEGVGDMLTDLQKQRYILVNRVDSPEQCNFYFSSILRYGSLKVAVSTDGASPTIGKIVKNKVEEILPHGLQSLVSCIKEQRAKGIINPEQTRHQLMKLFTHVYLIPCHDIQEGLKALNRFSKLLKLQTVLCLEQDCAVPVVKRLSHECFNVIVMDGARCDEVNSLLKSNSLQGKSIGVLIAANADLSHHIERYTSLLNSEGITVEVIDTI